MSGQAQYDVIILGAGPAGLSTALHLLRHDPRWSERILVLEKAVHPRFKLCGGAVTRLGLRVLQSLGFSLPLPLEQFYIKEVYLQYQDQTVTLHGKPQLVIFERAVLDAYLAKEAENRGIQIRQGETVQQLEFRPHEVILVSSQNVYRAQVIVGADGANGITRRWMRRLMPKARIARTIEFIQPATPTLSHFKQKAALFDFSLLRLGLQGYVWDFPFFSHGKVALNRGIYDARLDRSKPSLALPKLLSTAFRSPEPPDTPSLQGHPIHWFSPRNRFSAPRLLLVGDAAGVDPLFGEGIGPALAYGQLAAQSIVEAFARQDFSFAHYRSRLKHSYLGRYLMTRWITAEVCYRMTGHDWFPAMIWRLGRELARLFPDPEPLFSPQD
ncbi:MAG: NAD(P)/FAD-dependent oxidoreductase [Anaerolineales bacterium]